MFGSLSVQAVDFFLEEFECDAARELALTLDAGPDPDAAVNLDIKLLRLCTLLGNRDLGNRDGLGRRKVPQHQLLFVHYDCAGRLHILFLGEGSQFFFETYGLDYRASIGNTS